MLWGHRMTSSDGLVRVSHEPACLLRRTNDNCIFSIIEPIFPEIPCSVQTPSPQTRRQKIRTAAYILKVVLGVRDHQEDEAGRCLGRCLSTNRTSVTVISDDASKLPVYAPMWAHGSSLTKDPPSAVAPGSIGSLGGHDSSASRPTPNLGRARAHLPPSHLRGRHHRHRPLRSQPRQLPRRPPRSRQHPHPSSPPHPSSGAYGCC